MGSRFSMLHTTRQLSLESRLGRYRQQIWQVWLVPGRTASCWGTHMTSYSNSFHPLRHSSMITWSPNGPNGHEPDRKPGTPYRINDIRCYLMRWDGAMLWNSSYICRQSKLNALQYAVQSKHVLNLFKLAIKNTPTPIQFSTAWLANMRILVLELSPINKDSYNTGMGQKLDTKKIDGEKTRNRLHRICGPDILTYSKPYHPISISYFTP